MGYEMCVNVFWLFERTKWEEASLKSSKKSNFMCESEYLGIMNHDDY